MAETLRFLLCTLLLVVGLAVEATAVLGVHRFGYDLNRIHAAGMCDSLGLLLIMLSCSVYAGISATSAKLLTAMVFQWITSPVSGHLVGRLIYETDADLAREATIWKS